MKIIIEFKCMLTYTLFSMHTIFKKHHNVYITTSNPKWSTTLIPKQQNSLDGLVQISVW